MVTPKKFYRLVDGTGAIGFFVGIEIWFAVKETPEGYWIAPDWSLTSDVKWMKEAGLLRWTPKVGARYVQDSLDKAASQLLFRKRWQIKKLEATLRRAKAVVDYGDKLKGLSEADFGWQKAIVVKSHLGD